MGIINRIFGNKVRSEKLGKLPEIHPSEMYSDSSEYYDKLNLIRGIRKGLKLSIYRQASPHSTIRR